MKKTFLVLSLVLIFVVSGCNKETEFKDSKTNYEKKYGSNEVDESNSATNIENNYISIGDSITSQDKKMFPSTDDKVIGYQTLINESMAFESVINLGISGASLAINSNYPKNPSVIKDINLNDIKKGKLITILLGTNDFKLNVPIGEPNSADETTFYGAYNSLLTRVKENNSDAEIILMTPLRRNNAGYSSNTVNQAGNDLEAYSDAIKDIGEKNGLKVIDLFNNSGITDENVFDLTLDGLHPNNDGYKLIGDYILTQIH
ncbi:SGNH/GDSL hydrolase family protein [Carnobacterium divergens]|uniref:SGNH/GDSL hydrolase family protein n=1 Tax=Carnobacterium divergens TaxID=2748 RepID=UPI0039AF94E8